MRNSISSGFRCCPCSVCFDKDFEHWSENTGEEIQTLDDRWEAVAGAWTVEEKADATGWTWNEKDYCVRVEESDAQLVHRDGPRKRWPITLRCWFYGTAAGDQVRLVFDWVDSDNYKYAQLTVGTAPTCIFLDPYDDSAISENPGELALYEVVAGETSKKTGTAWRHGEYGSGPHDLLVSITRADYGEDTDAEPQLVLTATWGSQTGEHAPTVSYLGTVSSPRCGVATGEIDEASEIEFDRLVATWSPRVTSQVLSGYYGKCESAIPIGAQRPEHVADCTGVDVNQGDTISGDYTGLWHFDNGETYYKWEPPEDLVLAPSGGQLEADLSFRLVNPNPTKIWLITGHQLATEPAEGAERPYFDVLVYDHQASAWEKPPFASDTSAWAGQAILRPHVWKDAHPYTYRAGGYGIAARHVDSEGEVKLRIKNDTTTTHSDDDRLSIRGAWCFNDRNYPQQYEVQMHHVDEGKWWVPDNWLLGNHILTRQEGWPCSYIKSFGPKPSTPGESWYFLGIEPEWWYEPRTIAGSYSQRRAPGLVVWVRLYRWVAPADPSWSGGLYIYRYGVWVAAGKAANNSLWLDDARVSLLDGWFCYVSAVGEAP